MTNDNSPSVPVGDAADLANLRVRTFRLPGGRTRTFVVPAELAEVGDQLRDPAWRATVR